MHALRTEAQAVVIALERQVLAEAAVPQFDERAKLLRPVPRHAAPDGEDSQPLLPQQGGCEVFEIFERIEAHSVPAGRFAQSFLECCIQPEFTLSQSRPENPNAALIPLFP